MKATIVVNPVSGGRARFAPEKRVAIAREALDRAGTPGEVVLTDGPGHARELARAAVADGADLVVAWGGDGTINEVASALVGTTTSLGIVRGGSGNGLARELGVPSAPARAIAEALSGRDAAIDAGEIDGRLFLNLAGVGFDAVVAAAFNALGGERRGVTRYTLATLRAAFTYRAVDYTIEADGERIDARAIVVAIANLPQYGSNMTIAPGATPSDGLLDLVVIKDRGTLGRLGLAPRLFWRSIHRAPGVLVRRAAHIVVSTRDPVAFHVDGEPHQGAARVEARVLSAALTVRTHARLAGAPAAPASTAGILIT